MKLDSQMVHCMYYMHPTANGNSLSGSCTIACSMISAVISTQILSLERAVQNVRSRKHTRCKAKATKSARYNWADAQTE